MTLTELRQEVYNITNRPSLVVETLTAIRSATLKLHQLDYFYKDIVEAGISFPAAAYVQQIEYRALLPRWRALKYLRKTDSTGEEQGPIFEVIPPESVVDQYRVNRTNVCYVAGAVIQIRAESQLQYCLLGAYVNPDITEGGFNSWLATDHPYAIVFEAAALVFKMIGDTDQFAAYTGLAAMQAAEVRTSNIQPVGY